MAGEEKEVQNQDEAAQQEAGQQQSDQMHEMAQGEQVPTEDLESRIKPAISMIRNLLAQVEEKRAARAQEKATEDAIQYDKMGAKVVNAVPEKIYVSLDGDNIGNAVLRAEEKDDEETLMLVSKRIQAGQEVLAQWTIENGGTVIEQGGDEGLVKVPGTALQNIEGLRQRYFEAVGQTATVGVGSTISESTKARMLGKLQGKDRTVIFDDTTASELSLRMKDKDQTEQSKMSAAGLAQEGIEEPTKEEVTPDKEEEIPSEAEPQEPKKTPKFAYPSDIHEEDKKKHEEYQKWREERKAVR